MALQADGKIVAAGDACEDPGLPALRDCDVVVARYDPGGALDVGFGSGGATTIDLGDDAWSRGGGDVAIQPDGKIVLVAEDAGPVLIRLLSDGTLDGTFGSGGLVALPGVRAQALTLQADGMIVVAGDSSAFGQSSTGDFVVTRVTSAGLLDGSFGVAPSSPNRTRRS